MLLRQHRGRAEHGDLLAGVGGAEGGAHGHLGLAEADVAADQAVHRPAGLEVGRNVGDRPGLIGRLVEREGRLEGTVIVVWRRNGLRRGGAALGVEAEELVGHLADALLDPRLRLGEGLPAEPVELGAALAAAELLDLVQAVDREVELVAPGVLDGDEIDRG